MGTKINLSKADRVFDVINLGLLLLLAFVTIYPIYFVLIASVSDPYAVLRGEVMLWVKDFTLEPYKNVFANKMIWTGYLNSIINTVILVAYNLALTIPAAYVMTRKELKGRKVLTWFFMITMYFGGGMVPSYLLIRDLGLMNTRAALILPAGFSVYNMLITRASIQSNIPGELFDAARIDGASPFTMFFRIVLPLSKAIIAVITLYVAVGAWNSWFPAMLYITDKDLYPLQYVLRGILLQNQQMTVLTTDGITPELIEAQMRKKYMAQGMKYSVIFIASAPLLIAYPFVQKHFVKGVMIGSVKS